MDLRFLFIIVLLAVAYAQDEVEAEGADEQETEVPEECEEVSVAGCLTSLLELSELDAPDMDTVCEAMGTMYKCFREKAELCLDQEKIDAMEPEFQSMRNVMNENCGEMKEEKDEEEVDNPHGKCFSAEQEYIMQCVTEATEDAIQTFLTTGEQNQDKIKCGTYLITVDCIVTKAREKCGEEAAGLLEDELKDFPPGIKESCEAIEDHDLFSIQLLDDRKKK